MHVPSPLGSTTWLSSSSTQEALRCRCSSTKLARQCHDRPLALVRVPTMVTSEGGSKSAGSPTNSARALPQLTKLGNGRPCCHLSRGIENRTSLVSFRRLKVDHFGSGRPASRALRTFANTDLRAASHSMQPDCLIVAGTLRSHCTSHCARISCGGIRD
jgi:hypothetical protein